MRNQTWAPDTWRALPMAQDPKWPDEARLERSLAELRTRPPLVFAGEARKLRASLAAVSEGQAFLLQAGDCAEAFDDHSADAIRDKLKIILQMAVVLTYAAGLPVVKVGRIAGQFAKPRSVEIERIDGRELPAFRGHAVNDSLYEKGARTPDPSRLLRAYNQSAATLNLIRAFTKGGFADLRQIHVWNQEFVAQSPEGRRYDAIATDIERALRFMAACGIDLDVDSKLHEVDLYTSHEALLLGFEEALTREDSLTGDWYDCSAHMLWVGERTRQVDGAHAEFLSGIENPVAAKVGPRATPDDVVALCDKLDPGNEPGRLTLIARMGCNIVEEALPPLIRAVTAEGRSVVWVCDPMHGNTFTTPGGIKTRRFADILSEIRNFFATCRHEGAIPGGVHLELTDQDVTECLGGSSEVRDDHLTERYQALCDPRLNARQSLDLAFEIGEMLRLD
jgi:3-deoxy-7-phosphoheptulonate synthase